MSIRELTPRGRGGVSVLEVRGAAACAALAELAAHWRGAPAPGSAPRLVRLGSARLGLEEEALVLTRPDGVLEVHVHGSPPLVAALCAALGERNGAGNGATTAARGPAASAAGFTEPTGSEAERRHDALEARAEQRLAEAETLAAARVLLDQAEGALREGLEAWRAAAPDARDALAAELVEAGRVTRALVEPARVVLAGPVNMGKSTLFNLLVGTERVVVSDEAGTTRDVIEEPATLGAYPVRVVDTAGLRAAQGPLRAVEAAGQALGGAAAAGADWVVWLDRGPGAAEVGAGRLADGLLDVDAGDDAGTKARDEPLPDEAGPVVTRFVGRGDEPGDGCPAGTPRLAPRSAPERALADVRAAFHTALGLPAAPWQPGRAAPFDAATRALAAALLTAPDAPATRAALDGALS